MTTHKTLPTSNDRKKKRKANESIVVSDHESHAMTDEENDAEDSFFPTFLVAEATDGQPIKLSIFGIQKLLQCAVGEVKSAKKLRSGSVLIEVCSKTQADRALKLNHWVDQPVKITPHRSLNSSKGIIRCPQFKECEDSEVLVELKPLGVTSLKRFTLKKNGNVIPTGTFLLIFNSSTPPKSLKAAYMNIAVEQYIPNPLRCYNCQKYGHGKTNCKSHQVCARCGKDGHADSGCEEQPQCTNCSGNHAAYSKECPEWAKQYEITQIKHEKNISFPDAKRIYEQRKPISITTSKSYATVCKTISTCTISTQTEMSFPPDFDISATFKSCTAPVPLNKTASTQSEDDDLSTLGAVGGKETTEKQSQPTNHPHYTTASTNSYIPMQASTPKQKLQLKNTKPGPASSKQALGKKPLKGSNDPISLYNRFGSLDSMDLEVTHSPGKGPGGLKTK
jgi:hypothetical protein